MNEIKEFKIEVPEGYCIDKENSTFDCIKFKPKKVDYDTVAKALFEGKSGFFIGAGGNIRAILSGFNKACLDPNNCTSENQGKKLIAINKLMNVAKYLNGDWKPDWSNEKEHKFYIGIDEKDIYVNDTDANNESVCYFKCPAIAQQAINILGEDTIRLALSTDW